MEIKHYRRSTCRLCNKNDVELVQKLTPTAIADAFVPMDRKDEIQGTCPLEIYFCNQCGHVQLLDVVDPDLLFSDYIYETKSSPGLEEHFQKYSQKILDKITPEEGAFIVDIGSNDGTLLSFFQEKGMRVLGVDPAQNIAKKATDSGIETLPSFFSCSLSKEIRQHYGSATIVTANNVYAHSDDLSDITQGVRELLAPDGVFIFEVNYLVEQIQNMVFDYVYHEHLSYHSIRPFIPFFQNIGLELIDVERIPTKGGSLRCFVQCLNGPRKKSKSIDSLVKLEEELGLHNAKGLKSFAKKIEDLKIEFTQMISDLSSAGKTIAGFGACATGTTLIYHFDLGDKLDFIVDDNPDRQGLFSPGHHIPVLSSSQIYERKPDYVVILAWRFCKPILKQHQAFLDQGGHFIIPVPAVNVI